MDDLPLFAGKICLVCGGPNRSKRSQFCGPKCRARHDYLVNRETILARRAEYHRTAEGFRRRKAGEQARKARKQAGTGYGPCVVCGNQSHDGHHPDYAEALVTVDLCRSCHNSLHEGTIDLREYWPPKPANPEDAVIGQHDATIDRDERKGAE